MYGLVDVPPPPWYHTIPYHHHHLNDYGMIPYHRTNMSQQNESGSVHSLAIWIGSSTYFDAIVQAFHEQCVQFNVTCHTRYRTGDCPQDRIAEMRNIIREEGVQGICFNPLCGSDLLYEQFVNQTVSAGIPMVTYGRDMPNSLRLAHVTSDNQKMGREMARLLRKLRPTGGTYAIVGTRQARTQAFEDEITRYNRYANRPHWQEVPRDFERYNGSRPDLLHADMQRYVALHPTAIVSLIQTPMRHQNWTQFVTQHRNITFIGVDAADYQVEYLEKNYVDGLIAGLPYEIGSACFQLLYNAITVYPNTTATALQSDKGVLPFAKARPPDGILESQLVAYNKVPLDIPELAVHEENLLEGLRVLGYTCFGLVACAIMYCLLWTYRNRKNAVVQVAQASFLIVSAMGVLCMVATLIPLSLDDHGSKSNKLVVDRMVGASVCMSIPWLGFTGLSLVLAALLSKTFVSTIENTRVPIDATNATLYARHLLIFVTVLLSINWAILLVWTLVDPLVYVRLEGEGLDYWNRVMSTYGVCQAQDALAYLVPLGCFNFLGVLVVSYQAYSLYNHSSPLDELQYIGWTAAALLQGFLTGIPLVVVVREVPRAFYSVMTMTLFALTCVILGLLFVPKIVWNAQFHQESVDRQRSAMHGESQSNSTPSSGRMVHSGEVAPSVLSLPHSSTLMTT